MKDYIGHIVDRVVKTIIGIIAVFVVFLVGPIRGLLFTGLLTMLIYVACIAVVVYARRIWKEFHPQYVSRAEKRRATPTKKMLGNLAPKEKPLVVTTEHPLALLALPKSMPSSGRFAIYLALPFVYGIAVRAGWSLLLLMILAPLMWMAICYPTWSKKQIVITHARIIFEWGVITTQDSDMPVSKITDKSFTIRWHAKLLKALRLIERPYGDFYCDTAGQERLQSMACVADVLAMRNQINLLTVKSSES